VDVADVVRVACRSCRVVRPGARLTANLANAGAKRSSPLARWILPREIGEVSGLALTGDGRLLAHGDENGRVYVIDPRRGVLLKHFTIGTAEGEAHADFEGITLAADRIFMVASNGTLYEFAEGADGERVRYVLHDTRLGRECEFEGVAFDAVTAFLLLPCKTVGTKDLRDHLVMYRWRLGKGAIRRWRPSRSRSPAIGSNPWKGLHPSDITVDPVTGNYVLIAAQEKALIEITPSGEVVRAIPLPGKHGQAEGVALTRDGILVVGDEATNRKASLTLYRWPPAVTAPEKP
jgi:uncharacterized protein YjiK